MWKFAISDLPVIASTLSHCDILQHLKLFVGLCLFLVSAVIGITVKWLIIGDNLFGEIGKFNKFAKICCRQIITLQSLYIAVLEITKLIICQIVIFEKPPNIIATKYSRFTVSNQIN